MEKKPSPDEHKPTSRRGHGSSARAVATPPRQQGTAETMHLIELRPGFFLNPNHIVSVRVLPQEDSEVYAVMYLSNGDKQNLTRAEFTAITGEEPRLAVRAPQPPLAD